MSPDELEAIKATGLVQAGGGGFHRVAVPADPTAYKAAPPGDVFATYDVPTNALRPAGSEGWRLMAGPNSIQARLAVKKGLPPPELPRFQNLTVEQVNP
jgi:hypothetical protein